MDVKQDLQSLAECGIIVGVEGVVADFSLVSKARSFADLPAPSTSTNDSEWSGFCVMEAEER